MERTQLRGKSKIVLRVIVCVLFFIDSFLAIPSYALDGNEQLATDNDSSIYENAYIQVDETVESRNCDMLLSFDAFVDGFSSFDGTMEQYVEYATQKAIQMSKEEEHGIDILSSVMPTNIEGNNPFTQEAFPPNAAEQIDYSAAERAYNHLISDYPYLEGDFEAFVSSYLSSGFDSIDSYVSEVERSQPANAQTTSILDKWYENTNTTLPQAASYSQYGLLKTVKKGDLIYEDGFKYAFTGHISTVEGIFYSSQYHQFYIRVIEAIGTGVVRSVLDDTRANDFNSHVLRVHSANGFTVTDKKINAAVKFCQTQVGKKYKLDIFAHPDHSAIEESWYCSELAWASYYNQGINLDTTSGAYINEIVGATPLDIYNSVFTFELDYTANTISFSDVPSSFWAYNSIKYVAKNGLMTGTSLGLFSPSQKLNRGMFVTVLYRIAATPTIYGSQSFSDVPQNEYFSIPVAWATSNAITNGTTSNTFSPSSFITREQLVTMLYRFAKKNQFDITIGSVNLSYYSDASTISGYAITPMKWALSKGIVHGTTPSTLSPGAYCTRAEAATFFKNFINYVSKDFKYPYPATSS